MDLEALVEHVSKTRKANELSTKDFLKLVKWQFEISRIYYPGAETDDVLECSFQPREIAYLDILNDSYHSDDIVTFAARKGRRYYLFNDMAKSPFKDGAFDAVFYQDIHATPAELAGILRTLRKGGVIIYSKDTCEGNDGKKKLRKVPGLTELQLPFTNKTLTVFQKIYDSEVTAKNI